MRVGMYYKNDDVRVEDIPTPKIGDDELLVKVMASGICGSDVMEWYRIKKAPRVLGHEIAAVIVEVGKNVEKFKVGQRVFVSHHIPCNTCRYCLQGNHTDCSTLHTTNFDPGGFSEFIRIPALNVDRGTFVIPDEVSYEEGTFIEPLGCVLRGQRKANIRPGQSLLVIGSGISGLLHIALAKASGAGKIFATDINKNRLEAARRFGADEVFMADEDVPSKIKKSIGSLAERIIVCAGAESAFAQALKCLERGGIVELFAPAEPGRSFKFPMFDFWRAGQDMVTSYGAAPYDCMAAIDMIRSKRLPLTEMITHRLPMEKIQEGFKLVEDARESIKVIMLPQE